VKELTATFHSEVFRPIVTIVVPGFYATATISVAMLERFKRLGDLLDKYPGVATVAFLLVVLAVGLIMEEFGARIESHFDDHLKRRTGYERHLEEWFDYLRLAFEREPVGHRYLRTLVLRLKFELGMVAGTVPFALGALGLTIPLTLRLLTLACGLLLGTFLCIEAESSNRKLSELRREMLKKEWC
jgi:hypothetical protein